MSRVVSYVWDHVVAFVALLTTFAHIVARGRAARKQTMPLLSSVEKLVPVIVSALGQGAAFEAGKPVTIAVPAESITLDLTAEGLGKVTVGESGAVLTISKAV